MKKITKGFTLIELLAVMVILGIVSSIVASYIYNRIDESKKKTYEITKNNIEDKASEFLIENSNRLFFISNNDDSNIEYQCVTIQNLIDAGYFDKTIFNSSLGIKNRNVTKDDYVYIRRDKITKKINSCKFIIDDATETCYNAIKAKMDIDISASPSNFSKFKDVTLTYKIKNANNINDYKYSFTYDSDKYEELSSNDSMIKKVRVYDNNKIITGTITYLPDGTTFSRNYEVNGIDALGPTIDIATYNSDNVKGIINISLIVKDDLSGIDTTSFTEDDLLIKYTMSNGDKTVSKDKYELTYLSCENGNKCSYNLKIDNSSINEMINIRVLKNSVFDKAENVNNETNLIVDSKKPIITKVDFIQEASKYVAAGIFNNNIIKNYNEPVDDAWDVVSDVNYRFLIDANDNNNLSNISYYFDNEEVCKFDNKNVNTKLLNNKNIMKYKIGDFKSENVGESQFLHIYLKDQYGNMSDCYSKEIHTYDRLESFIAIMYMNFFDGWVHYQLPDKGVIDWYKRYNRWNSGKFGNKDACPEEFIKNVNTEVKNVRNDVNNNITYDESYEKAAVCLVLGFSGSSQASSKSPPERIDALYRAVLRRSAECLYSDSCDEQNVHVVKLSKSNNIKTSIINIAGSNEASYKTSYFREYINTLKNEKAFTAWK